MTADLKNSLLFSLFSGKSEITDHTDTNHAMKARY